MYMGLCEYEGWRVDAEGKQIERWIQSWLVACGIIKVGFKDNFSKCVVARGSTMQNVRFEPGIPG